MEQKRIWTKSEYDNVKKELELGVPIDVISKKYNRTIGAIKRKYYRGYMTNKRINSILRCFKTNEEINYFMKSYSDHNFDTKILMKQFSINSKQQLYNIAKELGVRRNNNTYKQ